MEKQNQNIRSWDDLIFENRNKAYGAYALRQSYSDGVLKGVLTSIGIATVVFIMAGLINGSQVIDKVVKKTTEIILDTPPIVNPEIQPTRTVEPVRHVNQTLTPVAVVTEPPTEPDPEPATTSTGTEGTTEGTGTPDTGSGAISTGTENSGTAIVEKNNKPFIHVEVMPEYKGGLKGMIRTLERNMRYPASPRRMGKEGTVYVEFVVSEFGEVIDVKVIKGFDTDCDKEAVRMVEKLTEWKPGLQNKIAVNVKMVLPIKFQLEQQ